MARVSDAEKWKIKRETVFNKFNGHCAYCGCAISMKSFQIDHVVPRYARLADHRYIGFKVEDISNLFPACASCNNYKRANSVDQFRKEIEAQIIRLRRDHPTFRMAERYGLIECNEDVKVTFHFERLEVAHG